MKFKEFASLEESLNTTADFFMTQDTDLPNRVVAAFNYDGGDYVMDMSKATKEGLYTMDLGLIVSKNKGYFRFKSATHIKPVLGTTIKALEASIPFLGANIKGLAISLPAKVSKNYVDLMKLLLQKTYLRQQFEFLPINHVGNSHQYLLLVRKGFDPKQIFKTKTFKDYGLNDKYTKDVPVPSDALDSLHPLKAHKMTYDLAPSKKYQFKGYDVDLALDNADAVISSKPVFDKKSENAKTQDMEKTTTVHGTEKPSMTTAKSSPEHEEMKQLYVQKTKFINIAMSNDHNVDIKRIAIVFGPSVFENIAKHLGIESYVTSMFSTNKIVETLEWYQKELQKIVAGNPTNNMKNSHVTDENINAAIVNAKSLLSDEIFILQSSDYLGNTGIHVKPSASSYMRGVMTKAYNLYFASKKEAEDESQSLVPKTEQKKEFEAKNFIKSISKIDSDKGASDLVKALAITMGAISFPAYNTLQKLEEDFTVENYAAKIKTDLKEIFSMR